MKKVLFIAIVAVASLASCKKDRVCTCTVTPTIGTGYIYTVTYFKSKKGDARQLCQGEATQKVTAGVPEDKTTCDLK
jgi:hypothetical protein